MTWDDISVTPDGGASVDKAHEITTSFTCRGYNAIENPLEHPNVAELHYLLPSFPPSMPYLLPSQKFIADILSRQFKQRHRSENTTGQWASTSDMGAKSLYTAIKREMTDLSEADWSYNHMRHENRTIRASVPLPVPTKQGRSEAAIEIKLPPRKRVTVNATIWHAGEEAWQSVEFDPNAMYQEHSMVRCSSEGTTGTSGEICDATVPTVAGFLDLLERGGLAAPPLTNTLDKLATDSRRLAARLADHKRHDYKLPLEVCAEDKNGNNIAIRCQLDEVWDLSDLK